MRPSSVEAQAKAHPAAIAHESGDAAITYDDLERQSSALARHLTESLPDDGAPVALIGHKEPEMLVAMLACAKTGHPYVPIDSSTPGARVEMIMAAAGHPLVLRPDEIALLSHGNLGPLEQPKEPGIPLYVIFTSGSTGQPKGVVITHGCYATFAEWLLSAFDWHLGQERVLNQAPFSFDLSVMDLTISLGTGGTLVSLTAEQVSNPKILYANLAKTDLTVWVSTPTFAQMCLVESTFSQAMLPRLRRFLFCGETLPPHVAAELLHRFPGAEVWNTYGPTEATVATAAVRVDDAMLKQPGPLPVGRAIPGTRVLILDENDRPRDDGERGQIVIVGPNVSPGYLGRAGLTAQSFFDIDGQPAYRTGDLGYFLNGMLYFEGRQDSQIKLHGYRIELGDVEANLRALAEVRDAVVLPINRGSGIESIAAFVLPADLTSPRDARAARGLRVALGQRLPQYMVPRVIHYVDAFPMTPNGKIDRGALLDRDQ